MMTVRDVMTRSVVTTHPDTQLRDVARLLVDHRISGIPVVDDAGTVVGVVSEADLLMKERGASGVRHRPLERLFGESAKTRTQMAKLAATTAGQAMTAPVVTISPSRSIAEAASLMTTRAINRLPVVDGGDLVGIVSRGDLVRAYLRSDEELTRTIREEILLRMLWLDPALFDVSVANGVVSIGGRTNRRSTAEMIERSVGLVPGIVELHADIRWTTDDKDLQPVVRDAVFPFGPR